MKKMKAMISLILVLLMTMCPLCLSYDTVFIHAGTSDSTTFSAMKARAEALVNYEWTPSQRINTWNGNTYKGKTYFEAGEAVKGVPYTLFTSEVVSRSQCSLSDYQNVVGSNHSTSTYCVSTGSTRTGPVYGTCCATFVAEVFWGGVL